ncbi:MAG: class I SAM-dependent DNA methyltransferase [Spirochaetota bacterium]
MNYERIAHIYDTIMDDYSWCEPVLHQLLPAELGENSSVLELGCGTGRILELLRKKFSDLNGIDISERMLEHARRRIPTGTFYRMDMCDFTIDRKFDLILCMFDTINHLLTFEKWKQTFAHVKNHLGPGGTFIMDCNTPQRLSRLSLFPPDVRRFAGNGCLLMETNEDREGYFLFDTDIFMPLRRERFKRYHLTIEEYTPPTERVIEALREHFQSVEVYDEDGVISNDARSLEEACQGRIFYRCRV